MQKLPAWNVMFIILRSISLTAHAWNVDLYNKLMKITSVVTYVMTYSIYSNQFIERYQL